MSRLIKSFGHAFNGIIQSIKSEKNLQIHIVTAILVVGAGFFFAIHTWEWTAVVICIVAVISMEILNTSIEKMMDLIHPEKNPRVKMIKDMAAGAVLISAAGASVVGLVIFLPKVLTLFGV